MEEGAAVEAVDKALYDFGMAMGPLGHRRSSRARRRLAYPQRVSALEELAYGSPLPEDRLCELGRYGQKTAAGWYKYDETRSPIHDPEVDEMVKRVVPRSRPSATQISAEEIVDRCIYALVNEGARILEEGIAMRPAISTSSI